MWENRLTRGGIFRGKCGGKNSKKKIKKLEHVTILNENSVLCALKWIFWFSKCLQDFLSWKYFQKMKLFDNIFWHHQTLYYLILTVFSCSPEMLNLQKKRLKDSKSILKIEPQVFKAMFVQSVTRFEIHQVFTNMNLKLANISAKILLIDVKNFIVQCIFHFQNSFFDSSRWQLILRCIFCFRSLKTFDSPNFYTFFLHSISSVFFINLPC